MTRGIAFDPMFPNGIYRGSPSPLGVLAAGSRPLSSRWLSLTAVPFGFPRGLRPSCSDECRSGWDTVIHSQDPMKRHLAAGSLELWRCNQKLNSTSIGVPRKSRIPKRDDGEVSEFLIGYEASQQRKANDIVVGVGGPLSSWEDTMKTLATIRRYHALGNVRYYDSFRYI